VLTTGAHFRAGKLLPQGRFRKAHIIGVFIARRAVVNEDAPECEA
jgi:hypothetical protein